MADIYAFLDLEGIEGEAQDSDYEGKIEILSVSLGASNTSSYGSGTGPSVAKGNIQPINFTKYTDKASVELFKRAVTGKPIDSGKLTLLKLSGDTKIPYYKVDMTNVVVTSFQTAASGDGNLPMESFSLSFVEVQLVYQPQGNEGDPAGNKDFKWNLQKSSVA
jgi:type VI secretion system secreted protein Hcp